MVLAKFKVLEFQVKAFKGLVQHFAVFGYLLEVSQIFI
jgi:hypothetical protein